MAKPNYAYKSTGDGYWEIFRVSDNNTIGYVKEADLIAFADIVKAFEIVDRMKEIKTLL